MLKGEKRKQFCFLPTTNEMRVKLRNISKSYSGNQVLHRVNMTVREGEIHALIGENGAGKSTLMKILIGVEQGDAGDVVIDGETRKWSGPLAARRAGIAMVFQELSLVPSLTVVENIFLGRLLRRKMTLIDWRQMKDRAKAIFADLDFSIDLNRTVGELAIAEQQTVEIARALVHDARLIILDEPTSALSGRDSQRLFNTLNRLNEKGVSIVFITHRLQEVFEFAHYISILRDGRMVKSCSIFEIDTHGIVHEMVGRELREQFPPRRSGLDPSNSSVALKVKNASRDHEFHGIDFHLRKGEILGFAGLVGAGRTELVEAIFGISQLQEGSIEIFGKKVKIASPTDAVQAGLGLIADDRKIKGLITEAEVGFNLNMATQLKFASPWGWRFKRRERASAEQLVSALRIKIASIQQPASRLSGGNQQKVAIAKTLNTDSSILIFDEPTRGIDVGAKREIYFLLRKLADEGAAIILVSSELEEILGLCDRIVVMHQGRITGEFGAEEATQEKIMQSAVGMQN